MNRTFTVPPAGVAGRRIAPLEKIRFYLNSWATTAETAKVVEKRDQNVAGAEKCPAAPTPQLNQRLNANAQQCSDLFNNSKLSCVSTRHQQGGTEG